METDLRILIIDDDDVDRMTVRRSLKKAGFKASCREATDAGEGLECLQRDNYDCAFLDYLLPDGDGLAVLRDARSAGVGIPIIMLTGHGDERLAVEMMQAGASDYVPKGELSPETLSQSLGRVLRVHQAEKERQRAEEELQKSNKRIIDVLESISDAFFAVDASWNFTYLNTQAETLLNMGREELVEKSLWEQLLNIPPWFRDALTKGMSQKEPVNTEGFYEPLGIWLEANVYPGLEGVSVYFRDISERKKVEERLSFLANFDALTGLPNRALLMDRLTQALTRVLWHGRVVALMFCDLDRFKMVNDTLGHNVGDHLLKAVAERFKRCVREGDTVARLGGDEFVILLNDVAKPDDIGKVARKVIESASAPVILQGHEVFVTASVGIAIAPTDGEDPDTLMKHADIAMYRAKEQGKNNYQLYSPSMNARTSDRLIMESALRRAVERNEFFALYQPKVDLQSGSIVGAEALVRWQHPELGMVSPGEFLPLAEETDLILAIDEWVMRSACAQMRQWQARGHKPLQVSVNLSDRQFKRKDLVEVVTKVLEEEQVSGQSLELELTERIVMQNLETATGTMEALRELGVYLSIDDFGTGYSSLSHLKRCPINTLKIDRSFIRDIETDPNDAAITEAIIAMAKKLKLTLVAEGVETEAQKQFLIEQGCHQMQGFLFSRPIPAQDFETLLVNQKAI